MSELENNQTLLTTLACAALNPALRNVLIFDAPPDELYQVARLLERLLRCVSVSQLSVRRYTLGAYQYDDDMWGSLQLPEMARARLFSPERNAHEFQLLTIANLSALNLVTARTCIMLIGAEVAHLERNGEHKHWKPQQCWLAACPSESIGMVSPHLFERFTLRLSWRLLYDLDNRAEREAHVQKLFSCSQNGMREQDVVPLDLLTHLRQAVRRQASITPEALRRVMEYLPDEQACYYPRRELTLARFACARARLLGDSLVTEEHVDNAAQILGFSLSSDQIPMSDDDDENQSTLSDSPEPDAEPSSVASSALAPSASIQTAPPERTQTAYVPSTRASSLLATDPLCREPYPEDAAPIEREAASLKLPTARFAPGRALHGPIIGVEQSDTLYDLALISTLLTAAKFQRVRGWVPSEPFHVRRSDLRCYRRGFLAEHLFLLILDYTCVRDNPNWRSVLAPYLREAYVKRASFCIVKIGAKDAPSPWRAKLISGKSILVPRINNALIMERGEGLPTPLAHGLELATGRVRNAVQHGRGSVTQVTLLVLSDGRGNVPLQISHENALDGSVVAREGLEDALVQARRLRTAMRGESFVLDPQPRYYPELPKLLAEALGAQILAIPLPAEMGEVEL